MPACPLKRKRGEAEGPIVDISEMLGDLYESADRAAVTELPLQDADQTPGAERRPGAVPDSDGDAAADPRVAELEAARLRAAEAAPVPTPTSSRTPAPVTLVHDPSHDDLLPRKGGAGVRRLRLRK